MENLQNVLEQLQQNVVNLTGAVNRQIEQISVIELRLNNIERANDAVAESSGLRAPATEAELNSISKLPDCVKDLQIFEGNPTHYISWVHNVESILKDYEIVREKPLYRAILKHIRQKIRGEADNALISYNIFDEEWSDIKKCLSLHYADKRDIQSLENQLINMKQGRDSINKFYGRVNHQLSLIINKIKTDDYSEEGKNVLVENYRYRALDVFVRGLPQNLSQLVKVQKPSNLPEAYAACIELENMNYRKTMTYEENIGRSQGFRSYNQQEPGGRQITRNYQPAFQNVVTPQRQVMSQKPNPVPLLEIPPLRPTAPKPPVPMEVDPSLQSMKINYMNRPNPVTRPSNFSSNIPRKTQRLYNLETTDLESSENVQEQNEGYEDRDEEEYFQHLENELSELNFMKEASQESPS